MQKRRQGWGGRIAAGLVGMLVLACLPLRTAVSPDVPAELRVAPPAPTAPPLSGPEQEAADLLRQMEAEYGDPMYWRLGEKAWYDAQLLRLGLLREDVEAINGLPTQQDIPWYEALTTAADALGDAYGLTYAARSQYTAFFTFNVAGEGAPRWQVDLMATDPAQDAALGHYRATVDARTGEVTGLFSALDGEG